VLRLWNSPNRVGFAETQILGGASNAQFSAGSFYCPSAGWLVHYALDIGNSDQMTGVIECGVPGRSDGLFPLADDFELGSAGVFFVPYPRLRMTLTAGSASSIVLVNMFPVESDDAAIPAYPSTLQGCTFLAIGAGPATVTTTIPLGATDYQVLASANQLDVLVASGGATREEFSITGSGAVSAVAGAQSAGWRQVPSSQGTGGILGTVAVTNPAGGAITSALLWRYDLRSGFGA
jgi:hypothetical protein